MIIHTLWARMARQRRIRRDLRRLEELDDALLRDIGISRHDLRAVAHHGRPPRSQTGRRSSAPATAARLRR